MWSPKFVELRDADGKLTQKTVQYTENGPIEILYPVPESTWIDLSDDEVLKLVEDNDWYNWPEDFVKIVEKAVKVKNNVL
jgi:hypothetical protein